MKSILPDLHRRSLYLLLSLLSQGTASQDRLCDRYGCGGWDGGSYDYEL